MKDKLQMLAYNIGAVLIGLVISGCMLLFMKVDPLAVCAEALGKIFSDRYTLGEILVKASPLIFTSLAFAFTYKANLFNIGAQGQFYAGSIAAITVSLAIGEHAPTPVVLLCSFACAFAAGALIGGLIGLAKARFGANEFLVSMMSTYVVQALMDYLLRTVLQETKAEYLQTDAISRNAYLPAIVPGTRIHLGFLIAALAAVFVWFLLYKTPLGFRIRAVGYNRNAAELGGIRSRTIFTEINGVQHMLLQNFNASIGSFGIGIAILANGNPIGCIFASILFGFLNVMGTTMGRLPGLSIPASIIDLIEGIVMVCVIVSYYVRSRAEFRAQKKRIRKAGG